MLDSCNSECVARNNNPHQGVAPGSSEPSGSSNNSPQEEAVLDSRRSSVGNSVNNCRHEGVLNVLVLNTNESGAVVDAMNTHESDPGVDAMIRQQQEVKESRNLS